jgi:hypothetical protein
MGEPPDWVTDLALAEKWHMKPWEVAEETPLIWVARQSVLDEILAHKPEPLVKHGR